MDRIARCSSAHEQHYVINTCLACYGLNVW
jgi:hypothetical protein